MKNIVLTGFMGTGKTVVGKKLAYKLNFDFVNTDNLIENETGLRISEIFSLHGEKYFRTIEKNIIKDISSSQDTVIATGGGVVLDSENISNLKKNGIIICLTALPEVILSRTQQKTHRPLLNIDNPLLNIKKLLNYRKPFYENAEQIIDTSHLSVNQVVEKIITILDRYHYSTQNEDKI